MKRLWFLGTSAGNSFMNELLSGLAASARRAGATVEWALDRFPDHQSGNVYVLIPHEFFFCAPSGGYASQQQLNATVGVCVEQPGTQWFETSVAHAVHLGGILDIHPTACRELERRGIAAEHLQLGYLPEWDRWHGRAVPRPVDLLYMGAQDPRRGRLLGSYARTMAPRSTRLLIPPERPKPQPLPNYLTGEQKHDALAGSKVLLNLHRNDSGGLLEWVRVIEAMSNGCVVVSEHSGDVLPLIPGEHFISGAGPDLALLADGLLQDPESLERLREAAYGFLRSELTMDAGICRLLELAEAIRGSIPRRRTVPSPAAAPAAAALAAVLPSGAEHATAAAVASELAPVRVALKRLTLELLDARRQLDVLKLEPGGGTGDGCRVLMETDTFRACAPRISVLISLHNYELEIIDALDSVAASTHQAYEVLVLDDASTDGSLEAVQRFLWNKAWIPAALLVHRANRGLARTRNALIERARGNSVLILDADNTIFPTTLAKLEHALAQEPGASFAYGMSVVEEQGAARDLLSVGPWDLDRLGVDNYIDAMALIRRTTLGDLGGFSEDIRMTGWEDYDLWLRMAERGLYPVHLPEIVGSYRRSGHSMLSSITNIDTTAVRSLLCARSPQACRGEVAQERVAARLLLDPAEAGFEMWLDAPSGPGPATVTQTLLVLGWAAGSVPVERVAVRIGELELEARHGLPRSDVAQAYPHLHDAQWSGFSLVIPIAQLRPGRQRVTVIAHAVDGRTVSREAYVEVSATAHEDRLRSVAESLTLGRGEAPVEVWVLGLGSGPASLAATVRSVERQSLPAQALRTVGCPTPSVGVGAASLSDALAGCSGDYVVLLRAGDELDPSALGHLADALSRTRPGAIYGDEDRFTDGHRTAPFYKPGFSPELLADSDYIGSCAAIRRDLLARAVIRQPEAEGGGELIRALLGEPDLDVLHVPRILSTRAAGPPPRPRVHQTAALPRRPLVSLVVPTAGRGGHLERCLRSVGSETTYGDLELVIVDTSGGGLPDVQAMAQPVPVRVVRDDRPFHYSRAVNLGVAHARGEYLVLLNDDVEVLSPDWLEQLLTQAMKPGVGVVGCKLVRSDGTIQHGGVLIHDGSAEHLFEFFPDDGDGYHGLLACARNCSAVTGACLMIRASLFSWLGGLDDDFTLDYGDTDLCLRALALGERVVWTPHAVLRHDERSTRGARSPLADLAALRKHWGGLMAAADPFYNPNLSIRPQFEPVGSG